MDLEDASATVSYLIRDRDSNFPALFDQILAAAGVETVFTGVRMPRMNSIMERWGQTCRHELLDRTLIWNERHLRHALRQFEQHHNTHQSHQAMNQAAPVRAVPEPITDPGRISCLDIRRRDRLAGVIHEYRHAACPGRTKYSTAAGSAPSAASAPTAYSS
ncbi:integrase-like protein [Streptomyces puniciscabiei]|uniref:Integrase-like protein n=1 Tax=Streptomyces puniciscabiei TaxID=164348 RepID=A0A542U869_9ACTN|nr:integrase core domain-containing protein [Streptomyces puniciscabiei]TQK95261.1 integrase-like protein [Streptomyces puniciscabiei]